MHNEFFNKDDSLTLDLDMFHSHLLLKTKPFICNQYVIN